MDKYFLDTFGGGIRRGITVNVVKKIPYSPGQGENCKILDLKLTKTGLLAKLKSIEYVGFGKITDKLLAKPFWIIVKGFM